MIETVDALLVAVAARYAATVVTVVTADPADVGPLADRAGVRWLAF